MKIKEQIDREIFRKTLLKFLAERFRLAFNPDQIAAMIKRRGMADFDFDVEDVDQGIAVIQGLGLINDVTDEMGATKYYKITSKGIIENERLNQ
jgi:hypothetical protein